MAYTRYLNGSGRRRGPPYLRNLLEKTSHVPGMISLAGGLPNPTLFPLLSATFKLKDGTEVELDEATMTKVQQYSSSQGYPPFLSWCEDFIKEYHNPPCMDSGDEKRTTVMVTSGAAEAYTKVFEMCVTEGDNVLVEIPTFSTAIDNLLALGVNPVGVRGDGLGMVPDDLRKVMQRWRPEDAEDPKSDIPKLIYIIPSNSNPSGATLPLQRKQEIYQIAREYNLLIIEDDPYYFLTYDGKLAPSFLSIDTDGRVLRADSFSKCMAAGLRVGILSGPAPLVSKVQYHVGFSQEHTNNLAQAVLLKIFNKWGKEGFTRHIHEVSRFYECQRNAMIASAEKWLTELAEWEVPSGGMYLWIRLKSVPDSRPLIEEKALVHKVALSPGFVFNTNRDAPSPYLRASFSLVSAAEIDMALQRLAEIIKEAS